MSADSLYKQCELKLQELQQPVDELSFIASILLINASTFENDQGKYECAFHSGEQVLASSHLASLSIVQPCAPVIHKEFFDVTAHWGAQIFLSCTLTESSSEFLRSGGQVIWLKDSNPLNPETLPEKYTYAFPLKTFKF